jgi:hypothetical protein
MQPIKKRSVVFGVKQIQLKQVQKNANGATGCMHISHSRFMMRDTGIHCNVSKDGQESAVSIYEVSTLESNPLATAKEQLQCPA